MTCQVVFDRDVPPAQILREQFHPHRAVLWLSGEIDTECSEALAGELAEQRRRGCRVLRVDTYGVTFMNSTALDVLLAAHRAWLKMRGTLVLIGVTGPTARLLNVTGTDREVLSMPPAADVVLGSRLVSMN